MSRINTNVNALIAQRVLTQQNKGLSQSLERLSTGLRINRGADDPAGLIASEKLRGEKAQINAAISNAERADQVVNVAEGGLAEINNQLIELQGLVTETANDAGLSKAEKEANQAQIDAILQTIDRVSSTTTFAGTKLLNGSMDFKVSGVGANVVDFSLNAAKVPEGDTTTVNGIVTQSAQHGGLFMSLANANLELDNDADSRLTFEVAGAKGSRQFSFASGTALTSAANAINQFKDVTGVSATVNGTGLMLKADEFGSDGFVSVKIQDADGLTNRRIHNLSSNDEGTISTTSTTQFSTAMNEAVVDKGQDIGLIVNGVTARGDGLKASVNSDGLALDLTLNSGGAQALGSQTLMTVSGGGAKFNLGPTVDMNNQFAIGIKNVASRNLGDSVNGFLNSLGAGGDRNVVDGNLTEAQSIVGNAIDQITGLRARLGALQNNTIQSSINSLGVALENTSAAESAIRDTDFAAETAELTRSQILVNAANSALGIAGSLPQNVLSLLG